MNNESNTLKAELQSYFDRVYPRSIVETEHTLGGPVHIRFELGAGFENGTTERVAQATNRAMTIFNDTFPNSQQEIFVLIYEFPEPHLWGASNTYLHQQFPKEKFDAFYNQVQMVDSRTCTIDENGNPLFNQYEARIIIGRLALQDIQVWNILNAIANTEMGFDPTIAQTIFFFDPIADKAFQMYDDRGCYVWSDDADKIRDIYLRRNDWIVDYHRPEIDPYFRQ